MQDNPAPEALLDIVAEFLRERVVPETRGHTAFHLRVAINVLALVRREITMAPDMAEAERHRLIGLTGRTADLCTLNTMLSDAIATGQMAMDDAALHDHLWQTTLEKMAVDQPRYAAYIDETRVSR
jgi:hypothetical protein